MKLVFQHKRGNNIVSRRPPVYAKRLFDKMKLMFPDDRYVLTVFMIDHPVRKHVGHQVEATHSGRGPGLSLVRFNGKNWQHYEEDNLAHELGHAIHYWTSRQDYLDADTPSGENRADAIAGLLLGRPVRNPYNPNCYKTEIAKDKRRAKLKAKTPKGVS